MEDLLFTVFLQACEDMAFALVINTKAWWEEQIYGAVPFSLDSICKLWVLFATVIWEFCNSLNSFSSSSLSNSNSADAEANNLCFSIGVGAVSISLDSSDVGITCAGIASFDCYFLLSTGPLDTSLVHWTWMFVSLSMWIPLLTLVVVSWMSSSSSELKTVFLAFPVVIVPNGVTAAWMEVAVWTLSWVMLPEGALGTVLSALAVLLVMELRGSSGHLLRQPILQYLKPFPYILSFPIFPSQSLQVQRLPLKLYAPTCVENMSYFIPIICLSFYIQNVASTICLSPINYKTPIAYLCI